MSGTSTPSRRLSSTTMRVAPPSRRKACSCNSAQIRELERKVSRRTDLRLVDRPRIAPSAESQFDGLPVRLAGTGAGTVAGTRGMLSKSTTGFRAGTSAHFVSLGWVEVGDHLRVGDHFVGRFCRTRVGDHLVGRFWRSPPPTTGRTHCNPSRFQVCAGGFATDLGGLLDPSQRPSQSPQSYDLLFLLFVQDIGHAHGAYKPPPASMSQTLLSLAGFQVILIGRFWVIAEGFKTWFSSAVSQ